MNYKFVLVDNASGSENVRWILPPPVIVGREPSADITINDPSISRRHCQFTLNSEEALVVRDLGSTNGIYIDGRRVDKAIVQPGTLVQIGAITLRPEWTEEAPATPQVDEVINIDATQPMKIIRMEQE